MGAVLDLPPLAIFIGPENYRYHAASKVIGLQILWLSPVIMCSYIEIALTETSDGEIGRLRQKRQIPEDLEMRLVALILLALVFSPSQAWVQTRKTANLSELVSYMGADREQMLYAGAKLEGKLMWYTSLAGGSYKALIAAFEAKYPGVRVDFYRAGGADLFVRISEEYKAGRYLVDTIETTEGNLMFMRDSRLLQPYNSPMLKAYPDDAKESAGKGLYYWALARESYIGLPITRISWRLRPCPRISTVFSTRISKARWACHWEERRATGPSAR